MLFTSYAQNMEDILLWRALKHVKAGFYIDVGAFSPDIDSVTRAFSERGWRGINIEPNSVYWSELIAKRPNDINLQLAASDREGVMDLYIVGQTGLTTVEADIAMFHEKAGRASTARKTPSRTLSGIWDEHIARNQAVHILKIDVEGHERAVLQGLDLTRHRPWVVLIEAVSPHTREVNHEAWQEILEGSRYDFVYFDGLNRFYVAREHHELKSSFEAPPNVFDQFVLAANAAPHLARETDNSHPDSVDDAYEPSANALLDANRTIGRLVYEKEQSAKTRVAESPKTTPLAPSRRFFWQPALFHRSGKPRKVLRRLLFHSGGKPRGAFRGWVQFPDGRPRNHFLAWMSSDEYQALRAAVALSPRVQVQTDEHEDLMSPRTRLFLCRIRPVHDLHTES